MCEISCDFFEEHDTEGDASEEDEAARPSIGDVVGHEVPAGEAKDEGGIQEEEGVDFSSSAMCQGVHARSSSP